MKFTDEQKKAIVARYENGGSIRLICSEFNIPRSTLYRWFKTYKVDIIANGTPFTAREINQMQKSHCKAEQYNHQLTYEHPNYCILLKYFEKTIYNSLCLYGYYT